MSDQKHKNPVEFKVVPNGPLHVKGKFTIIDGAGKIIEINDEAFLCRCGLSKTKPFCDCNHRNNERE